MSGHIVLCPNPRRDDGLECTRRAKALLEAAGETVRISPIYDQGMESELPGWAATEPIERTLPGAKLLDEYEEITPQSKAAEYVMLGMRTTAGISRKEYRAIYLSDFEPIEEVLRKYEKKGWVREENGRCSFTTTGFLLSNPLIGGLLDAQTQRTVDVFPWLGEDEAETDGAALPEAEPMLI